MRYLLLDINNFLYRTYFGHSKEEDDVIAGLAMHVALATLNKYYKEYNPSKIIMCFDRSSWRKEYTASEQCISKRPYKGHRYQDMTPSERKKLESFHAHLREFENFMRKHTSVVVLSEDGLEADDLASAVIQILADEQNEIIAVSTDKDFIQFLRYPNVRLIDPASGKDRTLEEWENDANLFLFEKCLRGDVQSDNIMSAYPRLRKTRIVKAYHDPYEHECLMNEELTTPDGRKYRVKEMFEENKLLIDLTKQPKDIKAKMFIAVDQELEDPGKFSYMQFIQFLGKFELEQLSRDAERFIEMLSR